MMMELPKKGIWVFRGMMIIRFSISFIFISTKIVCFNVLEVTKECRNKTLGCIVFVSLFFCFFQFISVFSAMIYIIFSIFLMDYVNPIIILTDPVLRNQTRC